MADDRNGQGRTYDALTARGLAGKRDYVRSLEQQRDTEAMALLVECLCDESAYLRELAEAALLRLGDRGGEALLPLLGQGLWFSRASAARVLGRIGHRPAAAPLLRLCADQVELVAQAAHESLVDLGRRGGAARIAWELRRLQPAEARERLARLRAFDPALPERLERLQRDEELMSADDPETLRDDDERVRASEEGVEWEVLTGPPAGAGAGALGRD